MAICMVLAVSMLSACSSDKAATDSYETLTEENVTAYKNSAKSLIEQIVAFSDEQIEEFLKQKDAFTTSALESWKSSKDSLGGYKSITSQVVVESDDIVTVTSEVDFEKAGCTVDLVLEPAMNSLTSMNFSVNETFATQMEKAGLNTLMGLGIVFLMLLFLSFVISLFRFVPKLEAKLTGAGKKEAIPVQKSASAALPEVAEEELADDQELVAVIAAAIAASENTSTDSFVVRSIRKSNKWKRA